MRTTKNTVEQKIVKEVKPEEQISFFDRHTSHWFIDTKTNELRIGKSFSDFLDNETENFEIKKLHSCNVNYWKFVETTDGKFILLSRTKLLK
jgi:hypothetical protein